MLLIIIKITVQLIKNKRFFFRAKIFLLKFFHSFVFWFPVLVEFVRSLVVAVVTTTFDCLHLIMAKNSSRNTELIEIFKKNAEPYSIAIIVVLIQINIANSSLLSCRLREIIIPDASGTLDIKNITTSPTVQIANFRSFEDDFLCKLLAVFVTFFRDERMYHIILALSTLLKISTNTTKLAI